MVSTKLDISFIRHNSTYFYILINNMMYFFKNNNIPNRKCQLNLKTREKTVKNYNMTIDDIGKCILDSDALNHLEKKIYSKGLNF